MAPDANASDARRGEVGAALAAVARRALRTFNGDADPEARERRLASHVRYLTAAVESGSRPLFRDYVIWAKDVWGNAGLAAADLAEELRALMEALPEPADPRGLGGAADILVDGLATLPEGAVDLNAAADMPGLHPLAEEYLADLLRADRSAACARILQAADDGLGVRAIYMDVLGPAQRELGRRWQRGEISVAQEHFATAVTQLVMSQLYPRIFGGARRGRSLVAACVGGDLHELGLRMVSDVFELDGWDTYFLGANTPSDAVVEALLQRSADILAVSATMPYHVSGVSRLIREVRSSAAGTVPILVGGYPFEVDPDLWRLVGADGHASDAGGALDTAARLVEGSRR